MKKAFKLFISIALLGLILYSVDIKSLLATIESIPLYTALTVIALYAAGQLISSWKWCLLVRASGIKATYTTALRAYFAGMYVNYFGLGMVGGDVARGLLVSAGQGKKAEGLASVVADRVHGLAVLGCIGVLSGLVFGSELIPYPMFPAVIAGCVALIIGWVVGPWILTAFAPKFAPGITHKLEHLAAAFPRDTFTLTAITLLSISVHILQIGIHAVMAYGLGANISWSALLIVIPWVNIASSLPISWQGLGVREKAYIFFLTPGFLSKEQAVAFGALWLLASTVSSAIGGVIALASGDLEIIRKNSVPKNVAANSSDKADSQIAA